MTDTTTCIKCVDGKFGKGRWAEPCDCPLGDTALFTLYGTQPLTGVEFRAIENMIKAEFVSALIVLPLLALGIFYLGERSGLGAANLAVMSIVAAMVACLIIRNIVYRMLSSPKNQLA